MNQSTGVDKALLEHLDTAARQEILAYIQQESAKAKIQTSVTQFTDMCFKKCVDDTITSPALDTAEEKCMTDCLNRFLDTNIKVVQILQSMQR